MRGNEGGAQLTQAIIAVARDVARNLDADWLELATVQPDRALKTDSGYVHAVGAYWILDTFLHVPATLARLRAVDRTGVGGGDGHDHPVSWPADPTTDEAGSPLSPGERVLVAWVNKGNFVQNPTKPVDVVVLGRLYVSQ